MGFNSLVSRCRDIQLQVREKLLISLEFESKYMQIYTVTAYFL